MPWLKNLKYKAENPTFVLSIESNWISHFKKKQTQKEYYYVNHFIILFVYLNIFK